MKLAALLLALQFITSMLLSPRLPSGGQPRALPRHLLLDAVIRELRSPLALAAQFHELLLSAIDDGCDKALLLLLADSRVDPSRNSSEALTRAFVQGHLSSLVLLLDDPRVDPLGLAAKLKFQHVKIRGNSEERFKKNLLILCYTGFWLEGGPCPVGFVSQRSVILDVLGGKIGEVQEGYLRRTMWIHEFALRAALCHEHWNLFSSLLKSYRTLHSRNIQQLTAGRVWSPDPYPILLNSLAPHLLKSGPEAWLERLYVEYKLDLMSYEQMDGIIGEFVDHSLLNAARLVVLYRNAIMALRAGGIFETELALRLFRCSICDFSSANIAYRTECRSEEEILSSEGCPCHSASESDGLLFSFEASESRSLESSSDSEASRGPDSSGDPHSPRGPELPGDQILHS